MKISVLDQSPIPKGQTSSQTLQNTVELAQLVDQLGYHRIWYSEHHGSESLAGTAPEILIAHIASVTKQIRVGSGGIMLMHYSPLKMAEVFKTLSTLHPNRIDFGVGRAPGGDHYSTIALHEGRQPNMYNLYDKLMDTMMFINEDMPKDHIYNRTKAAPVGAPLPEMWLLGSSGSSAAQAGRFGIGYSFAQFISGQLSAPILDTYRNNFVPSAFLDTPHINAAYFVVTAETTEEAEYQASSMDYTLLSLEKGMPSQILPPEEISKKTFTEMDKMRIEHNRSRMIVGSSKDVANTLRQHDEIYGINEAMIVSLIHNHKARLHSYQLLADELL